MRVKSMVGIGFLSMVAATGVMNVSDSVASDANRVDVIESIGTQGAAYPYSRPMSH